MKNLFPIIPPRLVGSGLLAIGTWVSIGQPSLAAQTSPDPTHAAHVASGAMPADATRGDPALTQQISELQAKVAQLESTLAQSSPPMPSASTGTAMPGMPAPGATTNPSMGMGMDKMKSGGGMASMNTGAAPAPAMPGMNSGGAAPAGGMMGMMSQMMGMMDKMMSMEGKKEMAGMGGGVGMDKMKMGGGGSMPPASAGGMSGGMGMDQMEMSGMMGMSPMGAAPAGGMSQSALPGFPGSSHLYHIGATDFFLNHNEHIALTAQQQAALNKAKEQAALAKSTADRAVQQAEQELWTLTSADQPDATAIQAKLAAIGRLTADERLAFIRAVGEASKILTDEQRKSLTGFGPPAPSSMGAPGAPIAAGG